jgi:predicted DsbA family dithiol-disulfide isomerase
VASHGVPFLPFYQRMMFGLQTIMQRAFNEVTDAGTEEGLQIRFDMIDTEVNTMDAHRLILWTVDERGNDAVLLLTELLFSYRFEQGKDIGN